MSSLLPASLDLKTEKNNAHNRWILSVAFSADGTKIVSGSEDHMIKVWGALQTPAASPNFPLLTNLVLNTAAAESLTMIAEKQNAHDYDILSVDYNHDGTKIVSACYGGTIKVWGEWPVSNCHKP